MPDKHVGRVLVVDDNEEAAELMQLLLNFEGYDTKLAFGGVEGLDTVESFKPHVICSDIGMPGMSCLEFGRALRASSHSKNVLLVAITGWNDIDTASDIVRAGFDFHFAKPVQVESVSRCLSKYFDAHPVLA